MIHADEYKFSDFTLRNYRKLLKLALKYYRFISFTDESISNQKKIILRHDIEFSISNALQIVVIDTSFGLKATCFLQIQCDFFNPFINRVKSKKKI